MRSHTAPVLCFEGFRVVAALGEHLEHDGVIFGAAHDLYVVEDVHVTEGSRRAVFEFCHARVERTHESVCVALTVVCDVFVEDALVVGWEVREEHFVPCSVDVFL